MENINVISPEGELQSLPQEQLQDALQSGYSKATPADYQHWVNEQKYGSPIEGAKAFLEGAGQAATFGLSTGLERALGVKPEAIMGREESQPFAHGAGQAAGLVGSLLIPEFGAAKLMGSAARTTAEALGLGAKGAGVMSQVGSAGVKSAVETMMLTGGDEVSKMLAGDPDQSTQTALTNIGLSGILGAGMGGALGSISPLWKATAGPKITQFLDMLQKKSNGINGVVPDILTEAAHVSGVEIPSEIKSLLSDSPLASEMTQNLLESGTSSGTKARTAFNKFKENLSDSVLNVFNKTKDDIAALAHYSESEAGEIMKKSLTGHLQKHIAPISEAYDTFNTQFGRSALMPELKAEVSNTLSQTAINEGWHKAESDAQMNLVSKTLEKLPAQENANDLKQFITNLRRSHPFGSPTYDAAKKIANVLDDAREKAVFENILQDDVLMRAAETAEARQARVLANMKTNAETYTELKGQYSQFRDTLEELNDRLHVGKYYGPESFIKALGDMSPEDIVRRLGKKADASLLQLLQEKFPDVAQKVREYHINTLLEVASRRAVGYEAVNSKSLFSALDKMSPELRQFILPGENISKADGLRKLIESIPQRKNPSGTAGTLDALWKYMPNSAIGITTFLMGHNPAVSFLLSSLGTAGMREGSDAIKLGLLKFLGNGQHITAGGFKSAVEFIGHAIKGENLINNSVKNIFKAGATVLPEKLLPTQRDREKLHKILEELNADSRSLIDVGGETSAYMPEHGTALGSIAASTTNYLNAIRPNTQKQSPLDEEPVVDMAQKDEFDRALNIAEQPLVVLNHIKDGTLTPSDMISLNQMYPNLYAKLRGKIGNELIEHVSKKETLPYKMRIGLSMFLMEPLDSTMKPESIQSIQSTFVHMPMQAQQKSSSLMNKNNKMTLTPSESREVQRSKT